MYFIRKNALIKLSFISSLLLVVCAVNAQKDKKTPPPPLSFAKGRLNYVPDSLGNRIPDFSFCGYSAGDEAIPDAPVRVVVPVKAGDATVRIQAALDYVASLPLDKDNLRGAVLLQPGRYDVAGQLIIRASGVVLRGSGYGNGGTILTGTGTDRQTLIAIAGKNDRQPVIAEIKLTDNYIPVSSVTFNVSTPNNFKAGDKVIVHRPSTASWIDELHTAHFGGGITALGWKPGQRDIYWDRTIVAVDGNSIRIDAPITTALDEQYGGGFIASYNWPGRIQNVGVENIRCISEYDVNNPKDEAHRWMAVTIENAADAWVRQVVFQHFAGSAVYVAETSKRITVEDCKSLAPVSEIAGFRRNTFFTAGQQTLFQRLYTEYGMHDFATGFCAPGPNAFVQCESHRAYSFSGGVDSWASGVLFDMVTMDGQAISFMNRGQDGNGAGWNVANSVFWNCSAARIDCYQPPTAQNWSFGSWAQFSGDGYWGESNNTIDPRSLYYAQLQERLKEDLKSRVQLLLIETNATSSPTVAQAAELTAISANPQPTVQAYIDEAAKRQPIPVTATGIKTIDEIGFKQPAVVQPGAAMQVQNSWLVRGNSVLTGTRVESPWWSGSARIYALDKAKPAITRFLPGQTGNGLTDDLGVLTDNMKAKHQVAFEQNYALWYERRRDDHERVRRIDGDVWAPFYELPFARSGKDTAWDGLSKYDLTKYNHWYWNRLKQFAGLADEKGLVLVHQNYFQHNIIEAGAHYADFPWRPVNNINNTGFPEPVPYAGDKRVFMAEQFYDVKHPVRRELHRAYIRQCLNNFDGNSGVIQLTSAEYTGPLHFVQFWVDVIKEWEKETGKKALIGLSATKDVQDAILADEARAPYIDIIDIRYWHYQADGSAYAPLGGQHLAPRQQARQFKPKKTSFEQVYRAVREYRDRFAGKAVMYSGDNYDNFGWAVFMAGGSLANIPVMGDAAFVSAAAGMKPVDGPSKEQYTLANAGNGYIVYGNGDLQLDLTGAAGSFKVKWFDAGNGQVIGKEEKIKGGKVVTLKNTKGGSVVAWIRKA
ncbi:DUF6298 domain-containing protein [Niastella populi]|uniref:Pectate lyase n=1 Tax=Niastella populi TaxID=550983 RepID=A0A1V9FNI9_9BACT|nr:DUF6298 domain-containing protein [Niastella populi]OQP59816.1 pectate lyase [Niastella populi]